MLTPFIVECFRHFSPALTLLKHESVFHPSYNDFAQDLASGPDMQYLKRVMVLCRL